MNEREQIEQLRKFADCDVPVTAKEAYDSMASYVGGDHEGACIKQVLEPMVDFHVDTAAKSADTIERLLAENERLLAYYEAIDNEAITTFTLNNKLSPREQLHSIIDWHIQIAVKSLLIKPASKSWRLFCRQLAMAHRSQALSEQPTWRVKRWKQKPSGLITTNA
jgi:hypothetical protein